MGSPSPTRFSSARAPALKLSGDTDGAAGELRFRKAPGRGTVFVCAEQLWGSMPERFQNLDAIGAAVKGGIFLTKMPLSRGASSVRQFWNR
jgi:hypothetical protein